MTFNQAKPNPMRTCSLLPIFCISFLTSTTVSQAQIILSFDTSTTTFSSPGSGQEVSIRLSNPTQNLVPVYGGAIYVQIGNGDGSPGTAPVIQDLTLFTAGSNPFTAFNTDILSPEIANWHRGFGFDTKGVAINIAPSADFVFAKVTIDSSLSGSGSWSLRMTGFSGTISTLDTFFNSPTGIDELSPFSSSSPGTGTFSAVPEPEETMAVMAGLSLGLGWWIRRRRAKGAQSGAPGGGTGLASR
jgi:hypothetical protein